MLSIANCRNYNGRLSIRRRKQTQFFNRSRYLAFSEDLDPADWASGLQVLRPIHDFTSYYHIGSAYKAAALLFVAQILPDEQYSSHTSLQGQDIPSVVLHHVSQISCRSQLFKSTIWPMYIAGAESTNGSQRSEVLAHFHEISRVIPWQTNNGAASVLGTVWERTDSSIETSRKQRNWLKVFQALDKGIYPA